MITYTVSELASLCGATLEGDGARTVVGPATLSEASSEEVSFLGNPRYVSELERTRAAAVLVAPGIECRRPELALLRCENPNRAFSAIVAAFRPEDRLPSPGVHGTASVDPSARLGEGVALGAGVVVGPDCELGEGVVLYPGVVLGAGVSVGEGSVLHANVVAYDRSSIGARCRIHGGTVLGSDGFGFEPGPKGWEKIPQCGTVVIEDEVEIGANVTVDRGRFGATRIGRGVKIDNLVHVAHNVAIGEGSLLIAQVGIAGSARLGPRVILGGQVGVAGHVEIGEGARVAGKGGVTKDLPGGGDYYGDPARPAGEGKRLRMLQARLPRLVERVKRLEQRLAELEERP